MQIWIHDDGFTKYKVETVDDFIRIYFEKQNGNMVTDAMKTIAKYLLGRRGEYLSRREVMDAVSTEKHKYAKNTVMGHLNLMSKFGILIKKGEARVKYVLPPLQRKNAPKQ